MQKTPRLSTAKVALVLTLLFVSCGYYSPYHKADRSQTLSIAHIHKDETGQLTNLVIEEMAKSALFPISMKDGRLKLFIELFNLEVKDIGFRYAREPDGTRSNRLVVSEKRLLLTALVTLRDMQENKNRLGPTKITASYVYDFDPDISDDRETKLKTGIVPTIHFSLGQLESSQSAQVVALQGLYRLLAKRITDYVICNHFDSYENSSQN